MSTTQFTKFTVPADGQWHELPLGVFSIIMPNVVELDDIGAPFRVRNLSRAPVEIEYQERKA